MKQAAKEGVVITNTSTTEPIVMLKHFAENPELVIEQVKKYKDYVERVKGMMKKYNKAF